jgi:hypothetical protein
VEHDVTFFEPFSLLWIVPSVLVVGLGTSSFGFTHLMVQVAEVSSPAALVLFTKGVLDPVVDFPRPPMLE